MRELAHRAEEPMKMPDGNTAALNEYEAKRAAADRTWAALEPEAREAARYAWWCRLSMEDVAEALYTLTATGSEAFLRACRRYQYAGVGALLTDALDRAAAHYLETDRGQQAIADHVYLMDKRGATHEST